MQWHMPIGYKVVDGKITICEEQNMMGSKNFDVSKLPCKNMVSIDGAGKFRQLVSITWPMIKPISLVCIVNILNGSFQMFDNVFVLTGGGPNGQTMVTGVMVYNAAFSGTQSVGGLAQGMGVASAMGWTVFIVTFTISLISMRLMRTDY